MHDRFRALFQHARDMEAFIFDEPLDVGWWRAESFAREQALKADPEATFDDKMAHSDEESADDDSTAYQMIYFVGAVLTTWITLAPAMKGEEARRATRVIERMVEYSTDPFYQHALSDRPIYRVPFVLVRFAHAGGLPALFDDWVRSGRDPRDGICPDHQHFFCSRPCHLLKTFIAKWQSRRGPQLLGIVRRLSHS